MTEQRIVYFGDPELLDQQTRLTRPINIVFLTSVRDVGTCDRNGYWVETGAGLRYMEGTVERTVRETHPMRGALDGVIRVVGVISDDTECDMRDRDRGRDSNYGVLPSEDWDWIHLPGLSNPDGQLISDITFNIPSTFRLFPKDASTDRARAKFEFEQAVLQKMRELGGDVLISDHYMARLDYLTRNPNLCGRLLNIHPAVTVLDSPFCFRGKYPTADAIKRAKTGVHTQTGATLHFMNEVIDAGPPIAYTDTTPVFANDDDPQWLRYRNYQGAKLPLFVAGMAHYAQNIYPYLGNLDINRLQRV